MTIPQGENQHYQEAGTLAASGGGNVEYYQLPAHLYGATAYLHG